LTSLTWAAYTEDNCLFDCRVTRSKSNCGCIPWYLAISAGADMKAPVCELSGQRCFTLSMGEHVNSTTGCSCQPLCSRFDYHAHLSWTYEQKIRHERYRWFKDNHKQRSNTKRGCKQRYDGLLVSLNCDDESPLWKQRLGEFFSDPLGWQKETAVVNVYFDSGKQLSTVKRPVTIATKASQLGGTLGLYTQFTGWSFITVLQVVILLLQGVAAMLFRKPELAHPHSTRKRGSSTKRGRRDIDEDDKANVIDNEVRRVSFR